jgi:peroxiredoxin
MDPNSRRLPVMAIPVGVSAPDFALTRRVMEPQVSLSDYRGDRAVVLLFFPLAFSSVCTEEICGVAEDYSGWTDLGAEVIGISVDSPFVNAKFAEETGAPFPILSDFNRDVATAYGVRDDDYFGMRGVATRSVFVIDRAGRVVYSWVAEEDEPPDLDRVRSVLRELAS